MRNRLGSLCTSPDSCPTASTCWKERASKTRKWSRFSTIASASISDCLRRRLEGHKRRKWRGLAARWRRRHVSMWRAMIVIDMTVRNEDVITLHTIDYISYHMTIRCGILQMLSFEPKRVDFQFFINFLMVVQRLSLSCSFCAQ